LVIREVYPAILLFDDIYLTRKNRKWLEEREIQIVNKPLGRQKKETSYEKSKKKGSYTNPEEVYQDFLKAVKFGLPGSPHGGIRDT
jgi:hypothetical protein